MCLIYKWNPNSATAPLNLIKKKIKNKRKLQQNIFFILEKPSENVVYINFFETKNNKSIILH